MDLVERLSFLFKEKGLTLSLAESCTGGLISSLITDIPGSSAFFLGAAVVYSEVSKMTLLGVKEETIKRFGAVSAETAEEMAVGAADLFGSDISASVTCFAGSSCDDMKGTTFISIHYMNKTKTIKKMFNGSRKNIKVSAFNAVVSEILETVNQ